MIRNVWTREETMLAFELYCTIPSGKVTSYHKSIVSLANAIRRTPGSVKLKLQNFKSYDPSYVNDGRVGLAHGSKLDKEICEEFLGNWDELVVKTQEIKNQYGLSDDTGNAESDLVLPTGKEVSISAKQRIGQSFFRRALNASYEGTCCITGINLSDLLRASHIKPWSKSNDANEKTNPQNGLLLNALHDVAFDRGYITISTTYKVIVGTNFIFMHGWELEFFKKYNNCEIRKPNKFLPAKKFIEFHNDVIFRG